jgi:O-antigen/teichoic acid export membrane protein
MGSLKSDILKVSGSNIIVLLLSVLNSFVLPIVLSVNGYANLKTYVLYAGFIGFLHFGFVDGVNIRFGGKEFDNSVKYEINFFHRFYIVFQFIMSLIILVIAVLTKDILLVFIGLTVLPLNLKSFFLFFYQAVGDLGLYSKLAVISPVISIILSLILIIFKVNDYRFFIIINIIGYYFSVLYIERKTEIYKKFFFFKFEKKKKLIDKKDFLFGFFYNARQYSFYCFF